MKMKVLSIESRLNSPYQNTNKHKYQKRTTALSEPSFQGKGSGAFLGAMTGTLATFFTGLQAGMFSLPLTVSGLILFLGSFLGAVAGDKIEDRMDNANKNKY